jgi:hypothetical protein
LGLFGKKPSRDDVIAQGAAQQAADAEASAAGEKKEDSLSTGNPKLDIELVKITAQLDSFGEIRKANSERFSRIGEQMGELRGMIMDTNKTISKIEVSATKAIDLVESVQPEKLMIEMRKMDGKIESLRANIESNESMMKDLMEELKKMRQQMNFYKGIEQVTKLNDEVKSEILEIKKVEATIERHADKGETIFIDMEKKFSEYEKFQARIADMDSVFHAIQTDFDKIKFGISSKADKKEFMTLMDKFSEFEKHTGEVLKLVDERTKQSRLELKNSINKMNKTVARKHGIPLSDMQGESRELPDVMLKPEIKRALEQGEQTQTIQDKQDESQNASPKAVLNKPETEAKPVDQHNVPGKNTLTEEPEPKMLDIIRMRADLAGKKDKEAKVGKDHPPA